MSSFDPTFEHFRAATGYQNRRTDHQPKFDAFRGFVLDGTLRTSDLHFVIQFVCHPNFQAHAKTVDYFELQDDGSFSRLSALPSGYHRANSYQNYKSATGHPKGLFYELNLYNGDGRSKHHTSRVKGSTFERDDNHDQNYGSTKGKHWRDD
jgi:hypothetical protein